MIVNDELTPLGRFYRGLLDLHVEGAPESLLEHALRSLVELTGASIGYLEITDSTATPLRWSALLGCESDRLAEIQRTISHGIVAQALAQGEIIVTGSALEDPRFAGRESVRDNDIQAVICAPVGRGELSGVVYLQGDPTTFQVGASATRRHIQYFGRAISPFVEASLAQLRPPPAAPPPGPFAHLTYRSRAMGELVDRLRLVAPLDVDLLFAGPTGAGKTMLARAVHGASRRAARAFVELNCAAVPEALFENELFGADEGAHSSVPRGGVIGKVEAAEGGTLFLDEIGELSLGSQAKLLSLLQSRTYYRLGASRPRHANVRVIAATNVELRAAVASKRFREDLFYRLDVMEVRVPALAERVEDIPLLAPRFVSLAAERHGLDVRGLSPGALRAVLHAPWPGNVRELAHRLETAALNAHLRGATEVAARDVFGVVDESEVDGEDPPSLQEATRRFQKRHVLSVLEGCDWNVSEAARRLDVARSHVYNLMRLYGLERG